MFGFIKDWLGLAELLGKVTGDFVTGPKFTQAGFFLRADFLGIRATGVEPAA